MMTKEDVCSEFMIKWVNYFLNGSKSESKSDEQIANRIKYIVGQMKKVKANKSNAQSISLFNDFFFQVTKPVMICSPILVTLV